MSNGLIRTLHEPSALPPCPTWSSVLIYKLIVGIGQITLLHSAKPMLLVLNTELNENDLIFAKKNQLQ